MRDDICSIPISEILEKKDGCPICTMRNMLEERMIDYVLGAAMMEPDVRIMSNQLGYCHTHLSSMMNAKNKLSLGLILETHLDEIKKNLTVKKNKPMDKKKIYRSSRIEESCFVCDRVQWGIERLMATLFKKYAEEKDVRDMWNAQEFLCLPHFNLLMSDYEKPIGKRYAPDFSISCTKLTSEYLDTLRNDVHDFTLMFDYRNSSDETKDFSAAKTAVLRASEYLTSRE